METNSIINTYKDFNPNINYESVINNLNSINLNQKTDGILKQLNLSSSHRNYISRNNNNNIYIDRNENEIETSNSPLSAFSLIRNPMN